jgi:uncharacterized membrane protein (UPF0127 family)
MKPRLAYASLIFLLLIGFSAGIVLLNRQNCNEIYRKDGRINFAGIQINVQIAKTTGEQEKGLGGKQCLAANQGMLFEFGKSDYYSFWMKDMKFPIDMIWIDSKHQVVDIKADVSPRSYPKSFTNYAPAQDVLELKSGQAVKLGLKTGSALNY